MGFTSRKNRMPNILVHIKCEMNELADWSILGDWIGKQVRPDWGLAYPLGSNAANFRYAWTCMFLSLSKRLLTAAAANYGCPMLWAFLGHSAEPPLDKDDGQGHFQPPEGGWKGIQNLLKQIWPSDTKMYEFTGQRSGRLGSNRLPTGKH